MDCHSKYSNVKKVYRRYKHKKDRDEFVSFFTYLIFNKAKEINDTVSYNKVNAILHGVLPDDVNTLVPKLLGDVYDEINQRCPSYSKEYGKILNKVSRKLVKAYLGNPEPTNKYRPIENVVKTTPTGVVENVAKTINTVIVPNQLSPTTAITPTNMLNFIRQVRDETLPQTSPGVFQPQDVKKILEVMVDLLASVLRVDKTAVRSLTLAVVESAFGSDDTYQQALRKYASDTRKFLYTSAYEEATPTNLRRLLMFYAKVFPKAKPLVARGGSVDRILSAVQSNPSSLVETYDFFKNLLLEVVVTTPNIEELNMSFVGGVEQVWKTMEATVLNEMSIPSITDQSEIRQYIAKLAQLLTKAKSQLLDLVYNKCRDEQNKGLVFNTTLPRDCYYIRADAERLDKIIEKLDKFIVDNEFDDFRDKLLSLTKAKVLEKVEDAIMSGKYTMLAAMANPVKAMKEEEFYSLSDPQQFG